MCDKPDSRSASSFDDHLGSTNLFLGRSKMIHVNSLMSRWIPLKQVIKSWILYTIIQCHLGTFWTHCKRYRKDKADVNKPWNAMPNVCKNVLSCVAAMSWVLGKLWELIGINTICFLTTKNRSRRSSLKLSWFLLSSLVGWHVGFRFENRQVGCLRAMVLVGVRKSQLGHWELVSMVTAWESVTRMLVVSSHLTGKGDDSNIFISFAKAGLRLDFNHHWPVVVAIGSLKQPSSTKLFARRKHYLNKWSFCGTSRQIWILTPSKHFQMLLIFNLETYLRSIPGSSIKCLQRGSLAILNVGSIGVDNPLSRTIYIFEFQSSNGCET